MIFKRKYKYLIFYWNIDQTSHSFGFGVAEITRKKKIKNFNDINSVNEDLTKELNINCTVINYKRI